MPPAMLANHDHISERESDGTWEDCTWDAGLEWYRLVRDASRPATHAEAQALRKASGEPATGGSNIGDLRAGLKARYGWTAPAALSGFAALWAALAPGISATVQGTMDAFGPTHRLSRWQRGFDGGHAVMVARVDTTDRVWWCDPLGTDTGYLGEWVTKAELKAFVDAFAGQHLVAPILMEEDMIPLVTHLPGYTANIKPESNLRSEPVISTATKVLTTGATKAPTGIIGTVKGATDPANGSTVWYELWYQGKRLYTAKDNVLDIKAPVAAVVDCTKAVADAVALKDIAIKGLKADLAVAAPLERERIALAEAARIKAL